MFNEKKEIELIVHNYCEKNKVDEKLFEVSKISKKATGGSSHILNNKTKVSNKNCTYVIKYYSAIDRIIVWNYRANKNMECNIKTINDKLNNGVRCIDKGVMYHGLKQHYMYFEKGNNLIELLNIITQKI